MGASDNIMQRKIGFSGIVTSIQPRTTVWRYRLDNRTHGYTGYNLFFDGTADGQTREFAVAISEKQYQNADFTIGDTIRGTAWTELYPNMEFANFYRAGGLKVVMHASEPAGETSHTDGPPWVGRLPDLATYQWRGARMLDKNRWNHACFTCKWAAMANVTIEYDWGVSQKHRFESFCYGPKSCPLYRMGRPRAVPYKDCGSDYDEGWMDDMLTEQRGLDE